MKTMPDKLVINIEWNESTDEISTFIENDFSEVEDALLLLGLIEYSKYDLINKISTNRDLITEEDNINTIVELFSDVLKTNKYKFDTGFRLIGLMSTQIAQLSNICLCDEEDDILDQECSKIIAEKTLSQHKAIVANR